MPNPEPAATRRGEQTERDRARRRVPPLGGQVLVGLVLGAVLGFTAPAFAEHLKVVGDAFIRLIQMSIIPLIFPLITVAIARMESARSVGRLATKTLLYFEVVTTVILALTLAVAFLTDVGKGADLGSLAPASTGNIQRSIDLSKLFLDIIPQNLFAALSQGNLLAILFFAVVFGLALTRIGDKAAPVIGVLDGVAEAMFRAIGWIIRLMPLAVVAFVAYNTAHYGWNLVAKLALFVAVFYLACLLTVTVLFPVVAMIFKVPYLGLLRAVADLVLVAFVTRSAEVVLAPLITRLENFGVDRKVPSFTLPIGYSFNADGATIYEALAVVFLAHAYGIELTVPRLLTTLLVLMLLTKGIAGVPSASIVVLFSASAAIGLPADGVAVLLAVDFVVDMARTALNMLGNSLATVAIANWEGLFRPGSAPDETRH